MVNPLFLLGPLLLKKAMLLSAANAYGLHRVYRRLLESTKVIVHDKSQRLIVQGVIKEGFRYPSRLAKHIDNKEVIDFASKYIKMALDNSPKIDVPPFVKQAASLVADIFSKAKK